MRWEGGKVGEYWDGEVGGSSLYSRVGGGGGGGEGRRLSLIFHIFVSDVN